MTYNRTTPEVNAREMVRQECERRHVSVITRWMIDRPRLMLWCFRLLWFPYLVSGNHAEWQSNCDILRVLITCEPDSPTYSTANASVSKRGDKRRRARLARRQAKTGSRLAGMAPITAPIAPQPWIARVWRSLRRSHVANCASTVTRQQNEGE